MNLIPPSAAKNDQELQQLLDHNRKELTEGTIRELFPVWMSNFRENLPYMWKEHDIAELPHGGPCIIIGAGPSLLKFNHLELLAKSKFKGKIFCCDRAFKWAFGKQVNVDYVVNADASDLTIPFIDHVYSPETKLLLSGYSHPKFRDAWQHERYWFVDHINVGVQYGPAEALAIVAKKTFLSSGANVGCASMVLAHLLGHDPICFIGMDCAYSDDESPESTPYWSLLLKDLGEEKALATFRHGVNPYWKNNYYTDFVFELYRDEFIQRIHHDKMPVVNCSGQGSLHPPVVKCDNFALFLKQHS